MRYKRLIFQARQHIIIMTVLSAVLVASAHFAHFAYSAHASETNFTVTPFRKSDLQILNDGGVLINVTKLKDETGKFARINSSVQIHAPPEKVWAVLVDCARAPSYVPGLKKCEILEQAADKSWDIRRHTNKLSIFLPTIKSEFKCDYNFPESISFKSTGGDIRTNSGTWTLTPYAAGTKTIVTYQAHVASKTIIPDKTIRKALKKNIPKVMRALRDEVMDDQIKRASTLKQ